MKKLLNFLTIFGVALSFAAMSACSMETDRKPGTGDNGGKETPAEVSASISLSVPGQFTEMQTRGLNETQESAVEGAMVLLFDAAGKFEEMFEVGSGNISSEGVGEATLGVQLPGGQHKLVVIANASADVKAQITAADTGATYATLMARLNKDISGKMFTATGDDAIPMWGETASTVNVTVSFKTDIDLVRSIARADIGVGKWTGDGWSGTPLVSGGEKIPFVLTKVYLVRANDAYSIVPDKTKFDGEQPSVPTGAEKIATEDSFTTFEYTDMTDNGTTTFFSYNIYLPEVVVTGVAHSEKTALVVGGRYDGGDETFYRVDFLRSGTPVDVLRNHLYRFEVTNVFGKGYDSPEAAYQATSSNMQAEVLDWTEEPFDDIVFNGEKSFAVRGLSDDAARAAVLGSPSGSTHSVSLQTNIPAFTMKSGSTTFASTDFTSAGATRTTTDFSYVLTLVSAGNYKMDITTRASNIGGAAAKDDVWAIDAGPGVLKYTLTVRQTNDATDPTMRAVTVTAGDGGSVMASKSTAKQGDEVKIVATPIGSYGFRQWEFSGAGAAAAVASLGANDLLRNPITFTMPAGDVTVNATFAPFVDPYIIYWDAASQTMQLGGWRTGAGGVVDQSNMLFFQFGGTIGFLNQNDAFDATDIKFNLTTDTSYASLNNWTDWFADSGTTYTSGTHNVDGFVSSAAYHNAANVQTGRGDPCKLVGLTIAQIKAGTIDNGKWRLPTFAELQTEGWSEYTGYGAYPAANTINTPAGVRNTAGHFLPAAGRRGTDGPTGSVGRNGRFWVSRPSNATGGYNLNFTSGGVDPALTSSARFGFGVRCVQDNAGASQTITMGTFANGTVTVNGTAVASGAKLPFGVTAGSTQSLVATPATGYAFWKWEVAGAGASVSYPASANPASMTLAVGTADVTVTPRFVAVNADATINGVTWAAFNVNTPGSFTTKAEEWGLLYQHGQKVGWSTSGTDATVAPFPSSDGSAWKGSSWGVDYDWNTNGNSPCPSGYAVPTRDQMRTIIAAGATNVWTTHNGVTGRLFVTDSGDNAIFLPAAGSRYDTAGTLFDQGTVVFYWSTSVNPDYTASVYRLHSISSGGPDPETATNVRRALSVRCVVGQKPVPPPTPTPVAPYIIYWDETSQTMALGSWNNGPGGAVTQANMLFFQFGSTIGFLNQEALADGTQNFDASDIKFNLTTDTSYTTLNNWTDWFTDNSITYAAATHGVDGFVSSAAYHNAANVQTGRGDPCKLVGLTIAQIKAGQIDNGKWRMPTLAEQQAEGWSEYTGYGAYPAVNTINSPAGVRNTAGHFLPASGIRNTDGTTYSVGRYGDFWVSRPLNASHGYFLRFLSGSVTPALTYDARDGFGVRCLPQ